MGLLAGGVISGSRTVGWAFTDRREGSSAAPYDAANLALHVGDGESEVLGNRAQLLAELGVPNAGLATMTQVHGAAVQVVTASGDAGERDGLVTTSADLVLLTQTADCVPILLVDADRGVVAAVHAGWRGVAADVVAHAIAAMADCGARSIEALIGPAICGGCYEVGAEVLGAIEPVAPAAIATTRVGTPSVDLRAGLVERLARLDVRAAVVGPCTYETAELYSYRRDGRTGRQAGAVWIAADESARS